MFRLLLTSCLFHGALADAEAVENEQLMKELGDIGEEAAGSFLETDMMCPDSCDLWEASKHPGCCATKAACRRNLWATCTTTKCCKHGYSCCNGSCKSAHGSDEGECCNTSRTCGTGFYCTGEIGDYTPLTGSLSGKCHAPNRSTGEACIAGNGNYDCKNDNNGDQKICYPQGAVVGSCQNGNCWVSPFGQRDGVQSGNNAGDCTNQFWRVVQVFIDAVTAGTSVSATASLASSVYALISSICCGTPHTPVLGWDCNNVCSCSDVEWYKWFHAPHPDSYYECRRLRRGLAKQSEYSMARFGGTKTEEAPAVDATGALLDQDFASSNLATDFQVGGTAGTGRTSGTTAPTWQQLKAHVLRDNTNDDETPSWVITSAETTTMNANSNAKWTDLKDALESYGWTVFTAAATLGPCNLTGRRRTTLADLANSFTEKASDFSDDTNKDLFSAPERALFNSQDEQGNLLQEGNGAHLMSCGIPGNSRRRLR